MKGRTVVLGEIHGRKVAALIEDGQLDDLLVDGADDGAAAPGTIFRGICDRPIKGAGGMMLRLPEGETAYLRGAKGLRPGQPLLVQVTGYHEKGKAIPVTQRVLFKSRFAILTPDAPGLNISRKIKDEDERVRLHDLATEGMDGSDMGLILRSLCDGADEDEIADDIAAMRQLAEAVLADLDGPAELLVAGPDAHETAWRDWGDVADVDSRPTALADHGVLDMIDAAKGPFVRLGSDGSMFVEPTRAITAVDVNTGADTSMAAGLKANIAAARALPRALRVRGIGGQITVDFAPMPKKERKVLEQVLKGAFRKDAVDTALAGWTPLGLFELQRKRERLPLKESLPS